MSKLKPLNVDCPRCAQPTGRRCLHLAYLPDEHFRRPHAERRAFAEQLNAEESRGSRAWDEPWELIVPEKVMPVRESVPGPACASMRALLPPGSVLRRENRLTRARQQRATGRKAA